jgi:sugar phosphate isomerase/epimerase
MPVNSSEYVSFPVSRRYFVRNSATLVGALALTHASALSGAPSGGDRWQIGCYTRPWDQFDYRVALDAIAEAGYKYAGLMTHNGKSRVVVTMETTPEEAAAIGEEVRKRGMKTISIWAGDFPVQKSVEAGIAGLKLLIDNCAAVRCPRLLLGGTGKKQLVQAYYKVVAECCDYAAAKQVGLSVKPHGGGNATGTQCRKIIEMVGHKNFGVWYDPGNIFFYSEGKIDPVDDVPFVNGLIAGMSIKDYKPPKEVMVTPGTGKVNFREVLARARKGGFTRGPLVVECLDRSDDAAKLIAEARKARRLLEELTAH